MDIKRLKYFCSVAKNLSFSKAAKENYMAQAAMSRYISSMEEELGFRLFARNRSKVELTPAGEEFYKYAVTLVDDYMLAQQGGVEIASAGKGWFTIGFGGFDIQYVRKYVPGFIKEHPEYTVSLKEYNYDSIVEALIARECGAVFCPSARLSKHNELRRLVTSKENSVIAVGEDHPLYNKEQVLPEELNDQTFICAFDTKHSWFQLHQLEYTCSIYGITPGKRIYTNSALSLLTLVEMNQGIAFLTRNVATYDAKIKLIPIISDKQSSRIHVVAGYSKADDPVTDIFLDYMERELKKEH